MQFQLKVTCQIKETAQDSEILVFDFFLGPLHVVCIGNLPPEGQKHSSGYVILELMPTGKTRLNVWETRKSDESEPSTYPRRG